ncbi:transcriptional regulator [Leptospira ryugenii]|uniref:Transcriptional regulator n=2 Tax=Leptospira ryugenii TaxID=1917863 RepID=A0A2P2E3G2_9LEPT|nr:YqgE/AlgH family protein [Leptospira ryugenii]GBF51417.1 transcriptional regulator [Leptospira ryugenii]
MTEMPGSTKGKLLISNSSVIQDFFHKSIILMVDHDEDGAFGLVLNKPTEQTLESLIKNLPDTEHADRTVYAGGPVDNMFVTIVHNHKASRDPGVEIIPGIFMARSYDTLVEVLQSPECSFRVFQGYSGWSPGQLEGEFEKLSWVLAEPKEEMIFQASDSEDLWKDALRSKGGIYKYFVEHTKDPLLN